MMQARHLSGIASSQAMEGNNGSFYMLQPCIPLNGESTTPEVFKCTVTEWL